MTLFKTTTFQMSFVDKSASTEVAFICILTFQTNIGRIIGIVYWTSQQT